MRLLKPLRKLEIRRRDSQPSQKAQTFPLLPPISKNAIIASKNFKNTPPVVKFYSVLADHFRRFTLIFPMIVSAYCYSALVMMIFSGTETVLQIYPPLRPSPSFFL
jgi:hypothetical protein